MLTTTRMDRITEQIEDYASDAHMDGYHQGYDEAWDEARGQGHDEGYAMGYQRALEDILEMIDETKYVMTPETREECTSMIESFKDNGPLAVMIYMNYLYNQIKSLEE